MQVGDTTEVVVLRDGKELSLSLKWVLGLVPCADMDQQDRAMCALSTHAVGHIGYLHCTSGGQATLDNLVPDACMKDIQARIPGVHQHTIEPASSDSRFTCMLQAVHAAPPAAGTPRRCTPQLPGHQRPGAQHSQCPVPGAELRETQVGLHAGCDMGAACGVYLLQLLRHKHMHQSFVRASARGCCRSTGVTCHSSGAVCMELCMCARGGVWNGDVLTP